MKKIITLLLLLNVLFFTFNGAFVSAADVVSLSGFKGCPETSTYLEGRSYRVIEGSTDCHSGSYYYVSQKPSEGEYIFSTSFGKYRSINYVYFSGTGSLEFYDGDNNLIKSQEVSSTIPVKVGTYSLKAYKLVYRGVDLLGVYFAYNKAASIICYASEGFTDENYKFYTGSSVSSLEAVKPAEKPVEQPVEQDSNFDIAELCKKIDEILDELKKGNSCDVCSKLSAILDDTNAINNNISQIKITTGYMNSHLGNISSKMDRLVANSADMREFVWDIRDAVIDSRDSLDRIDGNVNQLRIETERIGDNTSAIKTFVESIDGRAESIDNKLDKLDKLDELEGIRDGIDRIADDLTPTITPDFSAEIDKPDLPVLDIPTIEKQEDTNTYFTNPGFDGEAEPLPFSPESAENWKDDDDRTLDIEKPIGKDEAVERDKQLERDELLERDEPLERDVMERDEPLERDVMERDEPLERDVMERDEPLERDESLNRDAPFRRDEPLEMGVVP